MSEEIKNDTKDILESAPTSIPSWMHGTGWMVATFLSAFVAAYLAVSPDIKIFQESKKEVQLAQMEQEGIARKGELAALLQVVEQLSSSVDRRDEQVSQLAKSQALLEEKSYKQELKIEELQRRLDETLGMYSECKNRLHACEEASRSK